MTRMGSKVEQLESAGLIEAGPLPRPYEEVVEGMSDDEIKAIVKLKECLDKARETTPDQDYKDYFLPP